MVYFLRFVFLGAIMMVLVVVVAAVEVQQLI